ncbi:MAG: HAMP domain-containing sensor histidine kinase [Gemmatimonadota bacterium]
MDSLSNIEETRRILAGMRDASEREAQRADLERAKADLEAALRGMADRVQELEEARSAADDANAAKDQFLRTMSHELRTPLNAIGGFANLLEIGIHGPLTKAQREDLARIQSAQVRLLTLVNDVLNLSKLERGQVRYDIHDVPVGEIVDTLAAIVGPQAEAKKIDFDCGPKVDGTTVRADAQKLEQILLNLLANAIKFTPEGGHIALRCAVVGPTVQLTVIDTGPGIPTDRQTAVFEPFVQVDSSLTRTHEGSGLGLSISRELAQGMGGTITLESRPGGGSAFTVSLPRGETSE